MAIPPILLRIAPPRWHRAYPQANLPSGNRSPPMPKYVFGEGLRPCDGIAGELILYVGSQQYRPAVVPLLLLLRSYTLSSFVHRLVPDRRYRGEHRTGAGC